MANMTWNLEGKRGVKALAAGCALAALSFVPVAIGGEISVERGKQISIVGGCHDCHTAKYLESNGQIDPALALKGTDLGWQGPWGTTYALNLRITVADMSENEFVKFAQELVTRPPMPYFNIHAIDESDVRSLYQYIKSLGDPGDQAPEAIGPGETVETPFIIVAPPTMP